MARLQSPPGLDPDLYVSLTRRDGVILACIIGGALGLLLLALEIVVTIHAPANSSVDTVPVSSGLAGGIGSGAILALFNGLRLARHTRLARLSTQGLLIEMYMGSQFIPWTSIASLRRDKKTDLGSEVPRQTLTIQRPRQTAWRNHQRPGPIR
jgi:hypothetical protein